MDGFEFVSRNALLVRGRIAEAAARAGRDASSVEVMAVTKFHPRGAAEAAWDAGIRVFGESRVQEAEAKYRGFLAERPGARLELIGRLQGNKARKAVRLFTRVQSVDSLELLREIARRATAEGLRIEILLELHTGEETKSGFPDLDALYRACGDLEVLDSIVPRGVMTMAPYTSEEGPLRASFRAARTAFEAVRSRFPFPAFDVLSMGMSGDFGIAVEEGSTLVRIGTALFGEREAE